MDCFSGISFVASPFFSCGQEMMRQMRVVERRVTSLAAKSNQIRAMGKMDMQRKANAPWQVPRPKHPKPGTGFGLGFLGAPMADDEFLYIWQK